MARRIAKDLRQSGAEVWFDEWAIKLGDSFVASIDTGLQEADFVAVLLTRSSVASGWVEREWQSRIPDEVGSGRTFVLPLRGDECEIPALLRGRTYADFATSYDRAIDQLTAIVGGANSATDAFGRTIEATITDTALLPPSVILISNQAHNSNARHEFQQSHILLGRRGDCDVIFANKEVSGIHAEILFRAGEFWIRDQASKNGTTLHRADGTEAFVFGSEWYNLDPGDSIALASVVRLEFRRVADDA